MKLTWDELGEKLYQTGTKKGVLYLQDTNGTYPSGEAWSGLTGVTISPEGAEPTDLWADDQKYLTMRSAEKVNATIEAYMFPDGFYECDGSATPVAGLYVGQQTRKAFGFAFVSTLGNDTQLDDYGYIIHILYNCTASPSERAYATINDSPEAVTLSWSITTTPVNMTGLKPVSHLEIVSTKADATKLKALEDVLFGSENNNARLPLPDEVYSILDGTPTPTTYSISLNKSSTTITIGDTEALVATKTPADAEVTWTSSDTAVAEVSGGTVTAKAAGTATITASITDGTTSYTATCAVTVQAQQAGEG